MTKPLYAVFFALLLLCGLSACSKPETALPAQTTVLILGDSLTQGVGASSAQTNYPALLKQQSQWNIINGGVSGNTSAQALTRLPELLQQHQPKLVIISIGGNDFLQRLSNSDTQANICPKHRPKPTKWRASLARRRSRIDFGSGSGPPQRPRHVCPIGTKPSSVFAGRRMERHFG